MARDRSGLKRRQRRDPPSAAERAKARADKIFSRDPKRPMTEEEEEEAFYQACEKWCGILLRVGFLAYSLFGLLAALFEWSTRPPMRFDPPGGLAGTNVVLTGGCDGIGLETARLLARAGATVVVGCRPDHLDLDADPFLEPSEPASTSSSPPPRADPYPIAFPSTGGSAIRSPLDLADFASVRAFAASVDASLDGRVDALVHNAATPRACVDTVDGFDIGLQTNYLAPALLNRLLLPAVRRGDDGDGGRITHVSCAAASKAAGLPDTILDASEGAAHSNSNANADRKRRRCRPDAVYAESKRLLERHAVVLARRFERDGIVSNVVDPGETRTRFRLKADPRFTARPRVHPAALLRRAFDAIASRAFRLGPHGLSGALLRSTETAAAAVAHVAASPETGRVGGRVYADVAGAFTRETGCARADLADCGWARARTTDPGTDAKAAERRAARDEDDRAVWKRTSELLQPWSHPLEPEPPAEER